MYFVWTLEVCRTGTCRHYRSSAFDPFVEIPLHSMRVLVNLAFALSAAVSGFRSTASATNRKIMQAVALQNDLLGLYNELK